LTAEEVTSRIREESPKESTSLIKRDNIALRKLTSSTDFCFVPHPNSETNNGSARVPPMKAESYPIMTAAKAATVALCLEAPN
jgi:hypothetical protein